jgi:hypothetical protein
MQHIVDIPNGGLGDVRYGDIPFDELDPAKLFEISPLAGDEVVDDADRVTPADELFREVRADEAGAAGDEIGSHGVEFGSET